MKICWIEPGDLFWFALGKRDYSFLDSSFSFLVNHALNSDMVEKKRNWNRELYKSAYKVNVQR